MDPLAEKFMPNLIKMSSSTKKLVSQAGASAANMLLSNCSYHYRIINMLSSAMQDKNLPLRISVVGWLKTVVTSHADRKDYIEKSGGAESLEKCVKKGLTDASPKVREGTRELFWLFYQTWTDRGEG
jgi:CLIP-associating protein 1/2